MAVLDGVPGLEVDILVDGTPLKEYADPEKEAAPDTTQNYIEAISNSQFQVRCNFTAAFQWKHDLSISVFLDGNRIIASRVLELEKRQSPSGYTTTIRGAREREGERHYLRKFVFSQLDIVEDEGTTVGPKLEKPMKGFGDISVKARWVEMSAVDKKGDDTITFTALGTVSEKALKGTAISLETSLSDRTKTSRFATITTKKIGNGFFATFRFKYRSKEGLKALRIIPRTPSPVPLEDRDIDTLTFEETRELLKRHRDRENTARAIKKETNEKDKRRRSRDSEALPAGDQDDEVLFVSTKRRRTNPTTSNQEGTEVVDLTWNVVYLTNKREERFGKRGTTNN